MIQSKNASIDDVCACIGFSATVRLIEWYGGRNIYVPEVFDPDHPLVKLLGEPAMRALSQEFGSDTFWVPEDVWGQYSQAVRVQKAVARLLQQGARIGEVAEALNMSRRQVERIRNGLEAIDVVPRRAGADATTD